VLDEQAVAGVYAHLGEQLTHEQEPGITAFRNVRPGTVVRPAGARPAPSDTEGAGPSVPARPVPARRMPPRRVPPRSRNRGNVPKTAAGGRGPEARQHGATGAGALLLLAAFVIFAVYVLPYWGQ
jgi:hypothetical protein